MLNFQKIIVPVDLDKNTTKLVEYALNIASKFEAEVILLHTVEFIVMGEMALGNPTYDDYNTSRKEAARKALDKIVQEAADKGQKCASRVLMGDTVDEILACAKEEHCDLIIMGSHGKRGLEKILLGSVAERVLKNAHCPVLIMNPYR
ncbi:universal stress protein [Desulfopila aestuarii]|uniref:Universal stress protein n=1 Tax=Desulfopila aestuarii DSM 18488 TaxID=1121416 RepID=A0A1M7XVR7_9BACT|nr:universal stress protein [Desulfopila aestuarii]SHO42563.1 Nucleotide-binding universal stress protein, UspA family [Desulfopila aestuarii DSM 18488]